MAANPLIFVVSAAAVAACGPAYADRLVETSKPVQVIETVKRDAPYELEIIDKHGRTVPTHELDGRFYVEGSVGKRYIIRVTNPTNHRVEAVVSVDGLDVIDGETADYTSKRGYVVPAGGEVRIEGFRVSTAAVATFRFSSVGDSYAGRKGKPRNVGVIGLVVFEEKEQPQLILEAQPRPKPRRDRDFDYDKDYYWDDIEIEGDLGAPGGADRAEREAAPSESIAGGTMSRAPSKKSGKSADSVSSRGRRCCTQKNNRPGLGTEFGERRRSNVQWTKFERKNLKVPDASTELRYNDTDGLRAIGIKIVNPHTAGEIETRETANPFPNSRFATPPS